MLKTPPTIVGLHHLQIEAPPGCEEAARTFSGADHLIISTHMDFATETMRLTDGQGVHVVFDSVGRTTFDNSLKVLRARGSLIVFGLSSGPVPPFDMNQL